MKRKVLAVFAVVAGVFTVSAGVMLHSSIALAQTTPVDRYVNMSTGVDSALCTSGAPCLTVAGVLKQYNTAPGASLIHVTEVSSTVVNILCTTTTSGFIYSTISTTCNIALA